MDGQRFDQLTRSLAQVTTRRGALKTMLAGLAGGVAALSRHGAEAQTRQPNGAPCTRATDCASLKCVDGVCCNAPCTGQCEACNLPGLAGTCSPVTGTPLGGRPACPGAGPCKGICNGANRTSCVFPGSSVSCGAPTCVGGFQTTDACSGNGACTPTTTSCGLYACGPTGCLTACTSDAECAGAAFCVNGVCQGDQPLGGPSSSPDQCQSGYSADGVCCDRPCDGPCESCNLPGNVGFCTQVPDGGACDGGTCCDGACVNTANDLEHCGACNHACRLVPQAGSCEKDPICAAGQCSFTSQPQGTICRAAAGVCDVAEVCNGTALTCPPNAFRPNTVVCRAAAGPCDVAETCTGSSAACPANAFKANTVECRAANCANGVATLRATCPGNGAACPSLQVQNCAPFVCGGTACRTSCTSDDHCIASHHCDNGQCLPDEGLGESCDEGSDCQSGVCAQGVCCNEPCQAPCNICSAATGGVCTPVSCETPGSCQTGQGTCNSQTGVCDYPPAVNGTACGGGTGGRVCCGGICCQAGEECDDNTCQVPGACIAPGEGCLLFEDDCCAGSSCVHQSGQPAFLGVCTCAAGTSLCGNDCCGANEECVENTCQPLCSERGGPCFIFDPGSCCEGLFCERESPTSLAGVCTCVDQGEACSTSDQCCAGMSCRGGSCQFPCPLGSFPCGATCCGNRQHCVNGACQCVELQGACDPSSNLCCRDEETICPEFNTFGNARTCCRPQGGHCTSAADCCYEVYRGSHGSCGADGICGGHLAVCSPGQCADGLFCTGHCSNQSPVRPCFDPLDCECDVDEESFQCVRPSGLCIEMRCDDPSL